MPTTKRQQSFFSNVSAEPALFVFAFAYFSYVAAIPNLIQQKVCSPKSPPPADFVCNDTALLAQATDIVTVRSLLKLAFAAVSLFLAGFWRDSTGRNKPTLYFAIFWEIVGICIQVFAYFYWTSSPWITSITEGIISGLGGTSSMFFVSAICIITVNSKFEDRTTRLTFASAGIAIGGMFGLGLFGYLITNMGFIWFLILTISLHLAACVLVIIFVEDNKRKEKKDDICKLLKQLKSAFKRRPNITITWFMILASCLITVTAQGEGNVHQYYLQQAFGYSIEDVGLYTCFRSLVASIGSIIVSHIFVKLIKWSDFKIGIMCSLITIVSCISMVFAATTLEIKLFALLDITKLVLFGLPKSIISKCVSEDEIGMFISFCFIGECILPVPIIYIYDYIYTSTLTTLPGAFHLASAAILTILLIFYSISPCIYTPLEAFKEKIKNFPEDPENDEQVSQLPETSCL